MVVSPEKPRASLPVAGLKSTLVGDSDSIHDAAKLIQSISRSRPLAMHFSDGEVGFPSVPIPTAAPAHAMMSISRLPPG